MMPADIEKNISREPLLRGGNNLQDSFDTQATFPGRSSWKRLVCAVALIFATTRSFLWMAEPIPEIEFPISPSLLLKDVSLKKHIPPIKPRHNAVVDFLSKIMADGSIEYRREVTAPCGYGILLINIGPADQRDDFHFDIYQDAYIYSNNQGLCVLYPSYKGYQKSNEPFWEVTDPTEVIVHDMKKDHLNKISTRIVKPPHSKTDFDPSKRGGDFLIVARGNFYEPHYYQWLKAKINSWPADVDIEAELSKLQIES